MKSRTLTLVIFLGICTGLTSVFAEQKDLAAACQTSCACTTCCAGVGIKCTQGEKESISSITSPVSISADKAVIAE